MIQPASHLTRRCLISRSAAVAAGAAAASQLDAVAQQQPAAEFASQWQHDPDRIWLGAEFWANPLQDWRVAGGRIECTAEKPNRNVHVLTRELADREGDLRMSVKAGRIGGKFGGGKGSAGFKIAVLGTLGNYPEHRDFRNNLVFNSGIDCGITAAGALFFGDPRAAKGASADVKGLDWVELKLVVEKKAGSYEAVLSAHDGADGRQLADLRMAKIPGERLIGNLAIGANFGPDGPGGGKGKKAAAAKAGPPAGNGAFWFADWKISGSKVAADESHRFGPLLFNQYTLSGGTMKMSVQLPPIGADDSQTVRLQLKTGGDWKTVAEEKKDQQTRNAVFRIEKWDDTKDAEYRLAYSLKTKQGETEHFLTGAIRRDPVDKAELKVADVSCNIHTAFPNAHYVGEVAKLNPDLLAFVGDQFYESTAGYGVQRDPLDAAVLDYLRKWWFHGWTWRELTKDRPSVAIPDDHDVYQGNIWGEGGEPRKTTQEAGGYDMPAAWVNVVHRTQAAHHPDPFAKEPCKQGIINYYGPLTYGRISFAILADRQFKSAPEGKVPPTGDRGDHVVDMNFNPKSADLPGLELLGGQQIEFLKQWAGDWSGADMKAVISQTIFAGMATTHGGNREILRADYDQNGWPQSARNAALREIAKAKAFHIAGDQHLPAVVHYGIEKHCDSVAAFAGPAVNVGYPRWWEPTEKVNARKPGQGVTGDFTDHFGHPLTVLAVANGAVEPRKTTMENLRDKTSGFGLVVFNKAEKKVSIHCWPFGTDFGSEGARQFDGWPVVVTTG